MKYKILCYVLFYSIFTNAQNPWNEEDRRYLLVNLNRTTEALKSEVSDLSVEQWHFKEGTDKWSIAQVIEHLGIYERKYYDERFRTSQQSPEPALSDVTPNDAYYLEWMYEEQTHVASESGTPLELMLGDKNWTFFQVGRDRNIAKIKSNKIDYRAYYVRRKSDIRWNIHQLYIILFGHCDRHLRQIKRIKNHPNFPKN